MVLAGGRATRMGEADKGLLTLGGRALAAHVLDALRPQVAELRLSANRNRDAYAALGVPVVGDQWADFRGPLAGMHAAFGATQLGWLLAAPCDTPDLPADLARQLWQATLQNGAPAAYAVVGGEPVYPLCLLSRKLYAPLHAALQHGQYAVGRWLAAQGAVAVDVAGWAGPPMNLNTPQRLAAAQTAGQWTESPSI
ncbi:MAG: molybdenum cofactor guanylyltransferase MobA [Solimonas sp.]